jgi:hypothetical protein
MPQACVTVRREPRAHQCRERFEQRFGQAALVVGALRSRFESARHVVSPSVAGQSTEEDAAREIGFWKAIRGKTYEA